MAVEVKSTGNIKLLDQLGNTKYWELFANKKIGELKGIGELPDYDNLTIELDISQVIKPEERLLQFYNPNQNILVDTINPEQIIFGGFLEAANEIFENCWGLIGNIIEDGKRYGSIVIVYIEEFNICKYEIITTETIKLIEKNQHNEN